MCVFISTQFICTFNIFDFRLTLPSKNAFSNDFYSIATHLRLSANNKSKNAGRPYTFAVHFAVHFRRIVSAKRPHTFDYKTVYFRFLRTEYFYYIFSSRTVYFQSGLYTSHITRISCNYNVERKNNLFNGDTAVEPQRPYTFIC